MEQTKKRGGRPPKQEPATARKKSPIIRREIPDLAKQARLYECIDGSNFMRRLPTKNIQVYDEPSNSVRGIRYAPMEKSIYIDEQSEGALIEPLFFDKKYLTVPPTQPNLRAFMDTHPGNVKNGGNIFKLVQKDENVEVDVEEEFKVSDAISIIKNRPIDELLPVAMALNINTNQKDLSIKHALIKYAKNKPDDFMSTIDSPMVNARSTVAQSIDFQIIEERNGACVWFDTGKMIVSVPLGQDIIEVMTRFVMTDKGASVLSELERQLEALA